MKTITRSVIHALLLLTLFPALAFANGGDQRVLGQDYLINLSKSPFTPIAGVKTAMTVSFVDIKTGNLIKDDLLVTVRIAKGRGSMAYIYEQKSIPVRGGVLDVAYTFAEPGIHEVFFDFAYASDPTKMYQPPDFMMDIQPQQKSPVTHVVTALMLGMILGGVVTYSWTRVKANPEVSI